MVMGHELSHGFDDQGNSRILRQNKMVLTFLFPKTPSQNEISNFLNRSKDIDMAFLLYNTIWVLKIRCTKV